MSEQANPASEVLKWARALHKAEAEVRKHGEAQGREGITQKQMERARDRANSAAEERERARWDLLVALGEREGTWDQERRSLGAQITRGARPRREWHRNERMGLMDLERAIKRTEAVIGLPEHREETPWGSSRSVEIWRKFSAAKERQKHQRLECEEAGLPASAVFALLRDHAQAACDKRGWEVLTQSYQMEEADVWMINAYEVLDRHGTQIGFGETRLDAMLTALEGKENS